MENKHNYLFPLPEDYLETEAFDDTKRHIQYLLSLYDDVSMVMRKLEQSNLDRLENAIDEYRNDILIKLGKEVLDMRNHTKPTILTNPIITIEQDPLDE